MEVQLQEIKRLYYDEGLSAAKVGKRLGITVWQVIKRMKKNRLPRRNQAETHRLAFLARPPSFTLKGTLTSNEKELKIAGLMLYWGEGTKTGDHTVDLTNSDPSMIQLFLKMLRKVYGVKEERLRVLLYCYTNQNIHNLINYWVKITGISHEQFAKPYVRKDFLKEKENKMRYGLVHVRYSDKKLVSLIRDDIKNLIEKFL